MPNSDMPDRERTMRDLKELQGSFQYGRDLLPKQRIAIDSALRLLAQPAPDRDVRLLAAMQLAMCYDDIAKKDVQAEIERAKETLAAVDAAPAGGAK